jgi:hypothetical protein
MDQCHECHGPSPPAMRSLVGFSIRPLLPDGLVVAVVTTLVMTAICLVMTQVLLPWSHDALALIPIASQAPILAFDQNETFQITIFNDLHFGEGEDNRTRACFHAIQFLLIVFPQHRNGDGDLYQTSRPLKSCEQSSIMRSSSL